MHNYLLKIFLGILCYLPTIALTQIVSSTLVDGETGEPITAASIFISNSTFGTTSDANGFFSLDLQQFPEAELVVSHINYEQKSFSIAAFEILPEVIALMPRLIEMEEVVIRGKGASKRKRKKWIRQFEDALLGEGANREESRLLNPEILLFEAQKRRLRALAFEPLLIENKALGYNLKFYLDTFLLENKEDLVYAGKLFFEDFAGEEPPPEVKDTRAKTYAKSKSYFLKRILRGEIDESLFEVGIGTYKEGRIVGYERKSLEQLDIRRGVFADTLYVQNPLVLTDKANFIRSGISKASLQKIQFATSILNPKKGKIIVSPEGIMLNAQEVEESGYWTQLRLADLLPIDYEYAGSVKHITKAMAIADSLQQFVSKHPQEKLFLHLNKPFYHKRDELFFKAYLHEGLNLGTDKASKVVYVDLVNSDGIVIDSLALHTEKGLAGSFLLADSLENGSYALRAYTQNMRNNDPDFFFRQRIELLESGYSLESDKLETSIDKASPLHPIRLAFYPEGGDLVAGLRSKIAFEVKDVNGNPMEISMDLVDDLGNKKLNFKPSFQGIGVLNFLPEASRQYFAIAKMDSISYKFPLPMPLEQGLVMEFNNTAKEDLFIVIRSSRDSLLQNSFLLGHVDGQLFGIYHNFSTGVPIRIPKANIPSGIAHFTLFDQSGNPHAERLIFHRNLEDTIKLNASTNKSLYGNREQVSVQITLEDSLLQGFTSDLSVSVLDARAVQSTTSYLCIDDYLYFLSDLGLRNHPLYNSLKVDEQENQFFLDLLMLTKGWRRFNWENILSSQKEPPQFKPEKGLGISGFVSKKYKKEDPVEAKVIMNSLSEAFHLEETYSDASGYFEFRGLPFTDSTTFLFQAAIQKKNKKMQSTEFGLQGNRFIDFHLLDPKRPELNFKPKDLPTYTFARNPALMQQQVEYDSIQVMVEKANKIIDLDPVNITARQAVYNRLKINNVYLLDNEEWIHPATTSTQLLRFLRPSLNYVKNLQTGRFQLSRPNGYVDVKIYIDGLESEYIRFQALSADIIHMISIQGRIIHVTTRYNGLRSQQNKASPGTLIYTFPGYHSPKEFYATDYAQEVPRHALPDLRTAIHWEPNIKLDEEGKATISFYTADMSTSYQILLQGMVGNIPISKTINLQVE